MTSTLDEAAFFLVDVDDVEVEVVVIWRVVSWLLLLETVGSEIVVLAPVLVAVPVPEVFFAPVVVVFKRLVVVVNPPLEDPVVGLERETELPDGLLLIANVVLVA